MTDAPAGNRTIDLLVKLAWRTERAEAAAALADRMGTAQVLIFIRDPDIDAMLPAPGMEQTLRGGPAWRSFLRCCTEPGRQEAVVDLPVGRQVPALALVWGNVALIVLGDKPDPVDVDLIEPLLPLLGAALGCEQEVVVAQSEATAAKLAAGQAKLLAKALEASRAEGAALNARLRDEHRRKDDFLAMLAHELRNPLSPLVTSVELLRRHGGDTAMVNRQLAAMARQVDQLSRLVEDLLDVSRVSHGRISLRREVLSLGEVLTHALESSRLLIDVRNHQTSLEGVEEPLMVDADRVRLTQVFANLINNAAKYSEPGGTIRITMRREVGIAVVSIADTGMGISSIMLPRVFDLFEQSSITRIRAQGGLGIGLTLVRSLVALHGGTVQAQSPGTNQGSTFTVRLPLHEGMDLPAADAAPSVAGADASADQAAAVEDALRVLVVDDNRDAADSLSAILQMLGHRCEVAHSGLDALQVADGLDADLIMLDIGLPEIDGYELARRLRRQGHRHAWFVALTGYGSDEDRRRAIEAGFDEHVVKPVKLETLREILERTAEQRRRDGARWGRNPSA